MSRFPWTTFGLSLAVAVIASFQSAQAGFLPGFVGNSQFQTLEIVAPTTVFPTADGLVNFAVYENTGSDWAADLGVFAQAMPLIDKTVSASPVLDAKYVYFYQVVNTNPVSPDDALTEVQIQRGSFNSGGYLLDGIGGFPVVFNEAGSGATGPASNTALGTATTDLFPGNGVPGDSTGVLDTTPLTDAFVTNTAGKLPASWNLLAINYQFTFDTPFIPPPSTAVPSSYSTILFMTSNFAPTYLKGEVHDTGFTEGDIPSNVPELGTFAMSFCAIAFGLIAVANGTRKSRETQ